MNSSQLVSAVSALSIVIADQIPDNDDLNLLAAILTQLGDTLATIAARRDIDSLLQREET